MILIVAASVVVNALMLTTTCISIIAVGWIKRVERILVTAVAAAGNRVCGGGGAIASQICISHLIGAAVVVRLLILCWLLVEQWLRVAG